jgi:hypothetical protein
MQGKFGDKVRLQLKVDLPGLKEKVIEILNSVES